MFSGCRDDQFGEPEEEHGGLATRCAQDRSLLRLEQLGSHLEVWTMTVPADLDVDQLYDQAITLKSDGENVLQAKNAQYDAHVKKNKTTLSMLLPDSDGDLRPVSVKCRGHIQLRTRLGQADVATEDAKTPSLSQPRSTLCFKRRHPFFVGTFADSQPKKKKKKKH